MENSEKIESLTVEITKLSDEELKKKLVDLNEQQLFRVCKMAYYSIVQMSVELIKQVDLDNLYEHITNNEEKEMLANNYKQIIDLCRNYHLDIKEDEINKGIEKLLAIRQELYSLSQVIQSYQTELIYISELLDNYAIKLAGEDEYKNRYVDKKEIDYLIESIQDILAQNLSNQIIFISLVSEILAIVPFRMSKFKYFDIIESTLKRNLINYPINIAEAEIENYKLVFDSSLMENYGIVFDNFFANVQKFKNMNFKAKSLDELSSLSIEIKELSQRINEVEIFIYSLGLLINKLIIVYSVREATGFNFINQEIFENWSQYGENPEEESIKSLQELSMEQLNNLESELAKDIQYLQIINVEAANRKDLIDEQLIEEMLFTADMLIYYNDTEFTEYERLFSGDNEIINEDYLEQLIDNLISYINRSILSMSNIERKLRMRKLLAYLRLPFQGIDEFLEYIEYSLDERIVSKEEILFTVDAINYLINRFEEVHDNLNIE